MNVGEASLTFVLVSWIRSHVDAIVAVDKLSSQQHSVIYENGKYITMLCRVT